MKRYHKIQTIYKRDEKGKIIEGDFSIPEFDYLKDNEWIFTEKVDGTNIRVMFDGLELSFGGKTDNAQIPTPLIKKLQDRFFPQLETFRIGFPWGICLYGEGYGTKIQKGGGNYRKDQDFVLFDVKIGDWWLQRKDIEDIAKRFNLDVVPIVGSGCISYMVARVRLGMKSTWGPFLAEGVVARPEIELCTRGGERIITKIKYKDFLKE